MPFHRDFTSLRLQLAEALYAARECADVYHLFPEVGLTYHPDERVEYRYPSIAPWDQSAILTTIFALVEFGNFWKKNIFDGFYEVPSEVGELLERNDGAWRTEIEEIAQAKRRTAAQQQSIIHFVGELLELALPDSYLEQCPPSAEQLEEFSSLPKDETALDPLNVEERLLLIDKLWIPEWSAPLSKSARRLIGLVLAAIDGRPYAASFVTVLNAYDRPMVECNVDVEKAFGFSQDEATRAFTAAVNGVFRLPGEANVPIPFDFNT